MNIGSTLLAGLPVAVDGFALNSDTVPARHAGTMREIADSLIPLHRFFHGGITWVTGHTDAPGSHTHNGTLGLRRAEAVREQLQRRQVPARAIRVISAGEDSPVIASAARHPRNRRVVIQFDREPLRAFGTPRLRTWSVTELFAPLPVRRAFPRPGPDVRRIVDSLRRQYPPSSPLDLQALRDRALDYSLSQLGIPAVLTPNVFGVRLNLPVRQAIRNAIASATDRAVNAVVEMMLRAAGLEDYVKAIQTIIEVLRDPNMDPPPPAEYEARPLIDQ